MRYPSPRPAPSQSEFERGRWDVPRWAWVFLGIKMHPGQVRMADAYLKRTESRWRAFYLWLMVSAGNRAGKTLGLAVIILHSCVYRMGLQPPNMNSPASIKHWQRIPYHWWHFAVEQAPSEQVFNEIAMLLGGVHPAQKEGCPWSEMLGDGDPVQGAQAIATLTDTGQGWAWCTGPKERSEYAWIKLSPTLGGAQVHFRSTKSKALSAIGQNMHGLSFDEAGLEPNLDYLLEEVMHARRLGTGGQFIIISTPSVATSTDFQDLWIKGDPEDPFRMARRFSMRMSSRDNVGYGLDEESFNALIEGMPEDWIAQNIDGKFIQSVQAWFHKASVDAAFRRGLPAEQEPNEGRVYIQALDPGLKDKCWSLVFEVRPDRSAVGVSIERMSGKQSTRGIVALGVRQHRRYSMWEKDDPKTGEPIQKAWCDTGVDTTALGGHMFRELIEEHIPIRSVEFGGVTQVKRKMLSDLRTAIDEGRIIMPTGGDWREAWNQLLNYRLLDRKIEQDLVMALAIIAKLLRSAPISSNEPPTDFKYGSAPVEEREDDGINSRSIRRREREKREARRASLTAVNEER
jgi:hypothetical protein